VETNIIYKYRVPRAAPGNETTITTAALDLNPNEVLTSYHMVGEPITLQADVPKDYGEDPKEYVVLQRAPLLTQWSEHGLTLAALLVIVTDPDS
jgi:hypothetical protein